MLTGSDFFKLNEDKSLWPPFPFLCSWQPLFIFLQRSDKSPSYYSFNPTFKREITQILKKRSALCVFLSNRNQMLTPKKESLSMTKGSWRWSQLSEYFMPEELLLASNCLAPLWLWNGLCGQHSRYRTQPSLLCWFEDSFRLLPFEVYFFKHKRSRNEEGCALPPVVGSSGTSADTNACMSDHLEAATKVRIKKGFDSFSIFS